MVQTPDFNRKFTHFAKKKCNNPLPASAKSNWAKNNRRKPRVDRMEWSVACNRRLSTSNAPICFRMCPLKQTKPHVRHSEFSRCKPISFKFCFKTVPTRYTSSKGQANCQVEDCAPVTVEEVMADGHAPLFGPTNKHPQPISRKQI